MKPNASQSLRVRVLWPVAMVSAIVVVCVTAISYWIADWRSEVEQNRRFEAISMTLGELNFPLTKNVLDTISGLTGTELISLSINGTMLDHTLTNDPSSRITPEQLSSLGKIDDGQIAKINNVAYRKRNLLRRLPSGQSAESKVLVLFNESDRIANRRAIALLPLVTGLSTTLLLSAVAMTMTGRLIGRVQRLQERVAKIALGDFVSSGPVDSPDEIGQLAQSVEQMGRDLEGLWLAVNHGQRERLIHQLGAGLAHQLRNSLTGAKMAVELHARRCEMVDEQDLQIALRELKRTEADVQRILQLGAESPANERPELILACIEDAVSSVRPFAEHLHVRLECQYLQDLSQIAISNGQSLTSALNNLILNAVQAGGDTVFVEVSLESGTLVVRVIDNGPGPPSGIREELFEPFITSKPEGLGLGLALVRRCAEGLGGAVYWRREQGLTTFVMRVATIDG